MDLTVKELKTTIVDGLRVPSLISASLPENLLWGITLLSADKHHSHLSQLATKTRLQLTALSFQLGILLFCVTEGLVSSVQSLGRVWLFATPWIAARQASLSVTNSRSLLKVMSIESVMPSNHLILCFPLLPLPPIPPSIRVFPNESTPRMRWPKYWSFSFNISPSKEHPGLISFRMDCLDLLAVQGTLNSLLQHHSSKASILQHSALLTRPKPLCGSQ